MPRSAGAALLLEGRPEILLGWRPPRAPAGDDLCVAGCAAGRKAPGHGGRRRLATALAVDAAKVAQAERYLAEPVGKDSQFTLKSLHDGTGDRLASIGKSLGVAVPTVPGPLAAMGGKKGKTDLMGLEGPPKEALTPGKAEEEEAKVQLKGAGEDVQPVSKVEELEEEKKEIEAKTDGPESEADKVKRLQAEAATLKGDLEEERKVLNVATLYKFQANFEQERARRAALIADSAVLEARRQQRLARYWSREAMKAEAAAYRALPSPPASEPALGKYTLTPEQLAATGRLRVPPGWELPIAPLVGPADGGVIRVYSACCLPAAAAAAGVWCRWEAEEPSAAGRGLRAFL